MNLLAEIVARKRARLEAAKLFLPLEEIRAACFANSRNSTPHTLRRALSSEKTNIIAEFKRKSPSKGVIRADANATRMARSYEAGGAVAISVLTEEDFFAGSLEDLRSVRESVDLPVLRKDFVVDDYQVYEAAACGADAVLLIAAVLDDESLLRLRQLTEDELGMDALTEVHTSAELKRAIACGANLIGVNNRDLRTFEVSLDTSLRLAAEAPAKSILVSESGLHTRADLDRLREVGYRGFLIGESLMRANEPEAALSALIE